MAASTRPVKSGGPNPSGRETTFTRHLRFELADEENRALLGSYAISIALGVAFLLMVQFYPVTDNAIRLIPEAAPIAVQFQDELPPPEPPAPAVEAEGEVEVTPAPGPRNRPQGRVGPDPGSQRQGRPGSQTEQNPTGAISDAFGTGSGSGSGGMVGDVSGILAGVETNSGSGGTGGGLGGPGGGGAGGGAVLGSGQRGLRRVGHGQRIGELRIGRRRARHSLRRRDQLRQWRDGRRPWWTRRRRSRWPRGARQRARRAGFPHAGPRWDWGRNGDWRRRR